MKYCISNLKRKGKKGIHLRQILGWWMWPIVSLMPLPPSLLFLGSTTTELQNRRLPPVSGKKKRHPPQLRMTPVRLSDRDMEPLLTHMSPLPPLLLWRLQHRHHNHHSRNKTSAIWSPAAAVNNPCGQWCWSPLSKVHLFTWHTCSPVPLKPPVVSVQPKKQKQNRSRTTHKEVIISLH